LEELELEFKQNLQHSFNEIKQLKSTVEQAYKNKKNQKIIKSLTDCTGKVIHNRNLDTLKSIGYTLIDCPVSFIIHEKLEKLLKTRSMSLNTNIAYKGVDWGFAEQLALGCILLKGISVRLSGQDVQAGTFNQRHAVWKDQATGLPYVPLNNLAKKQGIFTVWNSPLAEYAVLGFEFGYSVGNPDSLTIWEAQYGDFSNGAQIIIDQWISTAQHKWGLLSKLVILLPHGYEGQGAEHSSARIERFLQSAADDNWCIAIPTTPAQYFHLLIRQALTANQKPLVVFTPKGLLRDSTCMSSLKELNEEVFQEVLCDVEATNESIIKDVIICCGKIYYDLIKEKEGRLATQVAIIRIEQLYPFNGDILKEMLTLFKNMQRCIWVQEEPQNMGAWSFIAPLIQSLLPFEIKLQYVGRVASNVTAVGSYDRHKAEQSQVIAQAFSGNYVNLYQIQHEIPI
jgi:2-oxoglutarate dehydrogenase E1 component